MSLRSFHPFHPFRLAAAALLSFAATSAGAQQQTLLDEFARDLQGLRGEFSQRVLDADGREIERSAGLVAIAVPRLFRWEYQTPFPQLIVADGERVFIYDPDLEQVTVRRQSDEEQASPLAALIEPGALERQFEVEFSEPDGDLQWVRLTPRGEETAFAVADIALRGRELLEMRMTDSLGQRTEIRFAGWQRNPAFERGAFRFVPPPGVEMVGDVEGAEVYPLD